MLSPSTDSDPGLLDGAARVHLDWMPRAEAVERCFIAPAVVAAARHLVSICCVSPTRLRPTGRRLEVADLGAGLALIHGAGAHVTLLDSGAASESRSKATSTSND